MAHGLLYHLIPGSRVIKKKKKEETTALIATVKFEDCMVTRKKDYTPVSLCVCVCVCVCARERICVCV